MNEELSKKIQERIDTEQITPLPQWRFLLLRWSFGLLASLSVIIGGFAVGAILFLFVDYHKHGLFPGYYGMVEFLLMVPFVWLFVLILFIYITKKSVRYTRTGYRYRLRTVFSVSILLSLIFGLALNYIGVGEVTHELLNRTSIYDSVVYDSEDAWGRPAMGRLGGTVLLVQDKDDFSVMDFNGRVWLVHVASSSDDYFVPKLNSTVRIFGILEASSSLFIARSVYEWEK